MGQIEDEPRVGCCADILLMEPGKGVAGGRVFDRCRGVGEGDLRSGLAVYTRGKENALTSLCVCPELQPLQRYPALEWREHQIVCEREEPEEGLEKGWK